MCVCVCVCVCVYNICNGRCMCLLKIVLSFEVMMG